MAQGEYVAILDGDDYWLENTCQKLIKVLDEHKEIGLAYGNYIIESSYIEGRRKYEQRQDPQENIFTQLLEGNFLGTNISIFRGELLKYVDWDILLNNNWSQDDYFIWLEFANHARFWHISDYVAVYTVERNVRNDNILYDSVAYDVTTTEVKEYYVTKYPANTTLTVDDLWRKHYQVQFRAAILLKDYSYAKDAYGCLKKYGENSNYYKLLSNRFVWEIYMLYRKLKHKERRGLDGYFY